MTYNELRATLKEMKVNGRDVQIKLSGKGITKEVLQAEYDRLMMEDIATDIETLEGWMCEDNDRETTQIIYDLAIDLYRRFDGNFQVDDGHTYATYRDLYLHIEDVVSCAWIKTVGCVNNAA